MARPALLRLPVTVPAQCGDHLCWAAVTAGLLGYARGAEVTQAAIVVRAFGRFRDFWRDADAALAQAGLLRRRIGAPLSAVRLRNELARGRPVAASLHWAFGGRHLVLITGWRAAAEVEVQDPRYGRRWLPLHQLRTAYFGFGRWTGSYLLQLPAQRSRRWTARAKEPALNGCRRLRGRSG